MLFKKKFRTIFYSYFHKSIFSSIKMKRRSLQAITSAIWKRRRKRASCPASRRGSVTVETAMALPIFTGAVCTILILGQMLLVEAEIQYAVSKTAYICAAEEAVRRHSGKAISSMGRWLDVKGAFHWILEESDLCWNCVEGGRGGIILTSEINSEEEVMEVCARYYLKVPIPFFQNLGFQKESTSKKRIFTGYVPHNGEDEGKDRMVYLAENGKVYHISPTCSHICLRISDGDAIRELIKKGRLRACEKCMNEEEIPKVLYVTVQGECYHSSLSCSGLKRTVRMVRLSEIPDMRICKDCAAAIK